MNNNKLTKTRSDQYSRTLQHGVLSSQRSRYKAGYHQHSDQSAKNCRTRADSFTQHETTFFYPLNTLNDLNSSTSTPCLNTLLMAKPSCRRRIRKYNSSCVIHATDGLIMISHVGLIGIKESSGRFLNVQQFHNNLSAVTSSNITLVT